MTPTAIITGGTKGIGRAIALKLAEQGYKLVLNYLSDDSAAHETVGLCRGLSPDPCLFKGDVADAGQVRQMVAFTLNRFQRIDAVINNAGRNIDKPLHQLSEADWDAVVNTNMKGVFLVSQAASRPMLRQESGGRIINIGATTGIRGRVNGINYCASKAGVHTMTKCLAMELGPTIRVNCVIPGFTRTGEIEERFDLKNREQEELRRRGIPLERMAEPRDIAEAVWFLLSPNAAYIDGQKLIVDGGEFMF